MSQHAKPREGRTQAERLVIVLLVLVFFGALLAGVAGWIG